MITGLLRKEISERVIMSPEILLVAISGSSVHGYDTPTSDIDVFVIIEQESEVVLETVRTLCGSFDVEVRTFSWLLSMDSFLFAKPHSVVEIGYSESISDLRFLVRIIRGDFILANERVIEVLDRLRSTVTFWAKVYLSGAYANLYQDLVGLLNAKRLMEYRLRVGELALRAAHLAICHIKLVDTSSKPAAIFIDKYGKPAQKNLWGSLTRLILSDEIDFDKAHIILFVCNTLVLTASPAKEHELESGEYSVSYHNIDIELCFLGVPGFNVLQNVRKKQVFIYSPGFANAYKNESLRRLNSVILK